MLCCPLGFYFSLWHLTTVYYIFHFFVSFVPRHSPQMNPASRDSLPQVVPLLENLGDSETHLNLENLAERMLSQFQA